MSVLTVSDIFLLSGCNLFLHVGLGMVVATEAAWMIGQLGGQPWHIGESHTGLVLENAKDILNNYD